MAPGQKLIAKRNSDSPKLTADKQYPVVSVMGEAGMADRFYIIDDEGQYCDFFEGEKDSILQIVPSFGTWRPIESAPKDGSKLLLYGKPWSDPVIGQYHTRDKYWMALNLMPYHYPPTHWTPLPELP